MSPKNKLLTIALAVILTSLLIAGCASAPPANSPSVETTQTGGPSQSATEESTLPPIPTMASVQIPTSMVLIEHPEQASTTAAEPASGATQPPPTAAPQAGCTAPAGLTPEETEGPYFKAGSPETTTLYQTGLPGTKLVLTGYVLTPDCQPVAKALVDFWQADGNGQYDNNGYTLRGHQYTDAAGRYQLVTVVPGLYPGRTEHIHVKVQAPNGPVLTTQLFHPDVASNQSDSIFNEKLVMSVQETAGGVQAQFTFIVAP